MYLFLITLLMYTASKNAVRYYNATKALAEAKMLFWEWQNKNQSVTINQSPQGRSLLENVIRSYDYFYQMYWYDPDPMQRAYYLRLYHESPFDPPGATLPIQKTRLKDGFLYNLYKLSDASDHNSPDNAVIIS